MNATIRGMVKIIQHISVSVFVELLGAESDYDREYVTVREFGINFKCQLK